MTTDTLKKELIELWQHYCEFLDNLDEDAKKYKDFKGFMIWLEIGRLNNGKK